MYIYNSNVSELSHYNFAGNQMSTARGNIGLPAGTYYIKIQNYYFSDVDYTVTVNYSQKNNWETEINDSLGLADAINTNNINYGSLMRVVIQIGINFQSVKQGQSLCAFHTYVDSGSTYWRMHLYNSNGEEQNYYDYQGTDTEKDISLHLTAGIYYLQIEDYNYSDVDYGILIIDPNVSDTTKPTGSISSTNNISSSQTVTFEIIGQQRHCRVLLGTSSSYGNNSYTATSSGNVTRTVSAPGTYYFTVRDTSGNVSSTYSVTFYRTTLNANGSSVSPSSVLTKSGKFLYSSYTEKKRIYL